MGSFCPSELVASNLGTNNIKLHPTTGTEKLHCSTYLFWSCLFIGAPAEVEETSWSKQIKNWSYIRLSFFVICQMPAFSLNHMNSSLPAERFLTVQPPLKNWPDYMELFRHPSPIPQYTGLRGRLPLLSTIIINVIKETFTPRLGNL